MTTHSNKRVVITTPINGLKVSVPYGLIQETPIIKIVMDAVRRLPESV